MLNLIDSVEELDTLTHLKVQTLKISSTKSQGYVFGLQVGNELRTWSLLMTSRAMVAPVSGRLARLRAGVLRLFSEPVLISFDFAFG